MLRKVKKQIENEFLESTTNTKKIEEEPKKLKNEDIKKVKITKPKKVTIKAKPIELKKPTNKGTNKDTKT